MTDDRTWERRCRLQRSIGRAIARAKRRDADRWRRIVAALLARSWGM